VRYPATAAIAALAIVFALCSQPSRDPSHVDAAGALTRDNVITWVHQYAAAEGVSVVWLLAVGQCESRLEPYAVGAEGEVGPYQWHPQGLWWSTPAATAGLSPWDIEQNVAMAAWAFKRGYASHWSCAR